MKSGEKNGKGQGKLGFNPRDILEKMRKDYWEGLAKPPADESIVTFLALAFEIEGQVYAVRVETVREVIKVPPWISKVPRSPRHLLGIMNLRGQIIPVLHMRTDTAGRPIDRGRIVVFKNEGQDIGLYADRIVALPDINCAEIQKPHGIAGPVPEEIIEGQVEIPDEHSGRSKIASILNAAAFLQCPAFEFRES